MNNNDVNKDILIIDGIEIKPNKKGYYNCPFGCGHQNYGPLKWKTQKGARKHIENCLRNPKILQEKENIKLQRKQEAMLKCPYKIGDLICYVDEVVVEPTHKLKFGRMVKVRYEEKKRFSAEKAIIKTVGYDYDLFFNNGIRLNMICGTMEEAEIMAKEKQMSHNKYLEFCSFVR
jgi:hypothetical protein